MKHIKLRKLILNEFKGFSFTLDPEGQDLSVLGANATGKTTLADAFSWLLFDKDSLGRSDFEIKNLDATGEPEHGLEHSVEAELTVGGKSIVLKKTYHEIWTKKRGSAQAVFSGNTTDYFIDSVPVKATEYRARIAEVVGDESVFRLLTSPTVFPALPWKEQRSLLLDACGDVTDAQVIETDRALAPLTELLARYTVSKTPLDDLKKVVTSGKTEANKEIDKIPVRIDEVRRGLPDVTGLNYDELRKDITLLESQISDAKLRLSGIDNGGAIAGLSKELQGLNYEIGQMQNAYYLEGMKHVTAMNARINELQSGKDDAERRVKTLKDDIALAQVRIGTLETTLEALRKKWTTTDAEKFHDTTEDTCPACGQSLPTDRVEDARVRALAAFNQDKAERLLQVETQGKERKAELDRELETIELMHAKLMEIEAVGDDDQLAMLIAERDILKDRAEDYSQIPGRAELLQKKADLEKRIQDARNGVSQDKEAIQNEIAILEGQLAETKEKADRFASIEKGVTRIEELKAEEKKLAAEFERLEQELLLIESFIKAKVSMLTEKINGLFQIARFKLFDVQVNGGIAECCEITVNGVPYNGGLNNAARINAGLDVCRTLSRHYGLVAPVFVDNAESVCELIIMDAQVIRLVVSEQDKTLRVETAQKRKAA